jgi:hypothetical protein
VRCYAGCSQADVIAALRSRGLCGCQEARPTLSRADRARWARERAEAERIRTQAGYFADSAVLMAECALDELSPEDPERARHMRLLMALRVSPEAEYRALLECNPTWAAALVHAGHERAKRLQMALARWIVGGMPGVGAWHLRPSSLKHSITCAR